MKLKIRFADQIVGLFVLLAIGALCGILILIGSNQRWFAEDYYYTSRFSSASSLSSGMAIKLKGFQIGAVDTITLLEDNNVEIRFHIYDTYQEKIYENSVLELISNPLGLGGGLIFHPGAFPSDPIPAEQEIPSLDFTEGRRLLKQGLVQRPSSDDAISELLNSAAPLIASVDSAVLNLTDTLGLVNLALEGDTELPLGAILGNVDGILSGADSLLGDVNTVLTDTTGTLYSTLDNLQIMSSDLRNLAANPDGLATTLLDPKGTFASLLDDNDKLYFQIQDILANINSSIAQLQTFTAYLNETQPQITGILEDGQQALDKGKDVLEGLSNNPLLRGGISQEAEQPTTFQGYRDEDF